MKGSVKISSKRKKLLCNAEGKEGKEKLGNSVRTDSSDKAIFHISHFSLKEYFVQLFKGGESLVEKKFSKLMLKALASIVGASEIK